ncbi:MAG: KUP/HAK/KT family potassium transporter [Chthoniobacterales bacterium]
MSAHAAKKTPALALAALGVVFGDIGTSPLYTYETALGVISKPDAVAAIGVASLIVWSLLIIVTLKYVGVVMRADYNGEGGVFALLALLRQKMPPVAGLKLPAYVVMLLFGAALLYGDGTITPAISVLSALEGLEAVNPKLHDIVLPATVALLAALFAAQRLGTGRLGFAFGWVMLAWFVTIGAIGAVWVAQCPQVLAAFNPAYALDTLRHCGWSSLFLMGGVVLAVTGVEALYADMGHFSRRAISIAWHFVALPALLLNYLGQAALAVKSPAAFAAGTPFFAMAPQGWPTLALVGLATAATVIASQALISGVFSLTAQARDLKFFPRLHIIHTSRDERGQVYVPFVNWLLAGACILLVVTFRTSANMAVAYGLAVVGTMLITTIALGLVTQKCWNWPMWRTALLVGVLFVIEGSFLLSSLTKLAQGGWYPLMVAGFLLIVMLTWHRGRAIIEERVHAATCPLDEMATQVSKTGALPGQLVLVTLASSPAHAVGRLQEMIRQGVALREQVIILSLVNVVKSDMDIRSSIEAKAHGQRLWHVLAQHGYMQEPHVPHILDRATEISDGGISKRSDDTFFVLPRELIIEYVGGRFARWRRVLFGVLSRNQSYAPDYFHIPHTQIIEFTWMMKA